MNDHLIPEKIKVPHGVTEMLNLPEQNKFALVNGHLEFAIATLNKNGSVHSDVISNNFPRSAMASRQMNGFYSDTDGKIFWIKEERSIVGINSVTNKKFDPLFAASGNSTLCNTIMENSVDEIIVGDVSDIVGGKSKQYLIAYDCKNNILGKPIAVLNGFLFFIGNKEFLYCETIENSMFNVKWHVCDLQLGNMRHNKLTDELTKRKITIWGQSTPVSPIKRMMIGCFYGIKYEQTFFSIRWDQKMEDVKIEPLLLQIPSNGSIENRWLFSDDGNWLTATFTVSEPQKKYTRIFFNIDDKYPQGVSLPVFGEETEYMFEAGCFVNHSDLGPLYLDKSPESDKTVNVYRLNDVYKVLANMAIGK